MNERDFQAQILQLARLSGWLCYHTHDSRRSGAGFPDLCLVRAPTVLFAELKSEAGRLRPEQKQWLEALRACESVEAGRLRPEQKQWLEALRACESVEARLWRPGDWREIETTLGRDGRGEAGA